MLYGDNKRRQMARSILPSKRRKNSRYDLRVIARAHRRSEREALRALSKALRERSEGSLDQEHVDVMEASLARATDVRRHAVRYSVGERREADKVSPLIRWAPLAVADLDVQDRLPSLRAWLPDGIVGNHAMSHVDWLVEPDYDHNRYLPTSRQRLDPKVEHEHEVTRVRAILDAGFHKELNRQLKAAGFADRLLLGGDEHRVGQFAQWSLAMGTRGLEGASIYRVVGEVASMVGEKS